jgi:hypothetical protein
LSLKSNSLGRRLALRKDFFGGSTVLSAFAKHEFKDGVEAYALLFCCAKEDVVCLWAEKEDHFDDGQVDEKDVSVLGALAGEEGDWVDAVGNGMANQRETATCDGDCAYVGGCEEEVEDWEDEDEDDKEDGGGHCCDVG